MSKAKHTPGPWESILNGRERQVWQGSDIPTRICGDMFDENTDPSIGEVDANAKLIAAAPELLEIAQSFFEWHANHFEEFEDHINMELLCLANEAEQAIKKAEGEIK